MKRIVCYLIIQFFLKQVTAQLTEDSITIKKIFDQTLKHGKAYDHLRFLCKQIGHRLSGSVGMYKAEDWGFKTLQALQADSVYFQECQVPRWIRGVKEYGGFKSISKNRNILTTVEGTVNILSLGNSVGTNGAPLRAELIEIKNYEDLILQKDLIKGKFVFYNYPFNQTFIRTFMGYGDAVKYRGGGASMASKYGAVGVIVRSVSTSPDNNPHTGSLSYNDSFPKIPGVAIGVQDADKLSKLLKNGKIIFSLQNTSTNLPDTIGRNVVAEIKGSEFPNKIITIGGHLDSWDVGEGAHDDGAGIVQSMEIINILKSIGYKPKHTIRAVLFANEENGLRGGNKYAELAAINNEEHIAAIESDAGGFSPRSFSGNMNPAQFANFKKWETLFHTYGVGEFNKGGGGADIGPLYAKFKTPVIGLIPDSQRYFDLHHSKTDVFEAVNKRELHLGAAAMAALVYLIDRYGL